jgi:hypothetical protein
MANPNIVSVSDIRGRATVMAVTTTPTSIITNNSNSNQVFKINSLYISNISTSNTANVNVTYFRSSIDYNLTNRIDVPRNATLMVITKDTSVYLEEGDSIRISANASGILQAVCSFETIS